VGASKEANSSASTGRLARRSPVTVPDGGSDTMNVPLMSPGHLFVGQGSSGVMTSYCWSHSVYNSKHIVRTCANSFPKGVRWLDIEKLVPGVALRDTLKRAVTSARLVLVFMSEKYWARYRANTHQFSVLIRS
jgi:hypothetical protein